MAEREYLISYNYLKQSKRRVGLQDLRLNHIKYKLYQFRPYIQKLEIDVKGSKISPTDDFLQHPTHALANQARGLKVVPFTLGKAQDLK